MAKERIKLVLKLKELLSDEYETSLEQIATSNKRELDKMIVNAIIYKLEQELQEHTNEKE